ncbi:MAG: GerMN domain-containing protein [Andreesenia angusta]|nr:GerMN domain-containing protein [Andreesenia angusta]
MKKIMSLLILSTTVIMSIIGCSEEEPVVKNDSTVQESQDIPADKEDLEEDKPLVDIKKEDSKDEVEDKEDKDVEINKEKSKDDESSNKNYLTEAKIYLVDDNLTTLKKFVKPVKVDDKKVATAALQALKDDSIEGYISPIPKEVSFNGISIDNGIATVKYTNSGQGGIGTAGESAFVSSIVYTLTEFPTIESVKFDSQGTTSILSHMDPDISYNRDDIGDYFKVLN